LRLFKSSEYAIRCLVFLTTQGQELCSTRTMATTLDIPYKFLGRLLGRLSAAQLVEAVQGKNGGYRINRPLEEIHLADIIDVVEGLESYDRCILGFETCDDKNPCPLHPQWSEHKQGIQDMMRTVTLAEMARNGGKLV
jgi:Rrf2 family iron-sulfur cluster assembly transcriptional regulator